MSLFTEKTFGVKPDAIEFGEILHMCDLDFSITSFILFQYY